MWKVIGKLFLFFIVLYIEVLYAEVISWMTDDVLIRRFLEGDTHAFNLLVWRWEKPILNFVYRNIGNRETAQDICQLVFIRVFKKLKTFFDWELESSGLYSWLKKIASEFLTSTAEEIFTNKSILLGSPYRMYFDTWRKI